MNGLYVLTPWDELVGQEMKLAEILYSKKLWRGKNFGEFGESQQFANFFANFHFGAHAVTR